MDAVTYPRENVIKAMNEHVVALRIAHNAKPISEEFNVKWTPALYILDSEGKVHMGCTGFLPAEEFIPWLIMGHGMVHFDHNELEKAAGIFESIQNDHADSDSAPQALFFNAVCKYKINHAAEPLKEVYGKLQNQYPSSIWSKKALPYRLL